MTGKLINLLTEINNLFLPPREQFVFKIYRIAFAVIKLELLGIKAFS